MSTQSQQIRPTVLPESSQMASGSFHSGRTVVLQEGSSDSLTVFNPDGLVELSVRFTADGPCLCFASATIHLAAKGDMRLDCENLAIRARQCIEIEAGRDVRQWTEGRHVIAAGEEVRLEGANVEIEALQGAARVRANDEVQLLGEAVLLNCDPPEVLPGWAAVTPPVEQCVPMEAVSGSENLVAELERESLSDASS